MADHTQAVKWLSTQLSYHERQILSVQADLKSAPMLSRWEDLSAAADADALLAPVLLAIRHAAAAIGAEPVPRSRRGTIDGLLSIMLSDLIDLEPGKLRSRWGLHDLPPAWAKEQARQSTAVELARYRLHERQPY